GQNTVPDPRDPDRIYYNGHFGDITWIDMRNGEERYIQPYPVGPSGEGAEAELYRFNWNSPIHMSPSNPDVVYYGGNVLFRTTDRSAPDERFRSLCVRDDRLRPDVAESVVRAAGLRSRRARRSAIAQSRLRRNRAGHLCLLRSRRSLDRSPPRPAAPRCRRHE